MLSSEIRSKYIEFFKSKNHVELPSASLIPENDSTTLFNTAGMQPLIPFLMGEVHPANSAITNCQKCVRTGDIEDVGDNTHCTFFEMLGNWPLGHYGKKQAIEYSFEFLTNKKWLGIDPNKLFVTVFEGDKDIEKDNESIQIWKECFNSVGIKANENEKIFALPKDDNFWGPVGASGPCGPDTEMFIDVGREKCSDNCRPGCKCGKYIEIWNDVFMFYYKNLDGTYKKLDKPQIDTGFGLERATTVLNNFDNVYDTDLFKSIIEKIKKLSNIPNPNQEQLKSMRIISDHIRSAVFIMGDDLGIAPSNTNQGYVVRRLIRTAIRHIKLLNISEKNTCSSIANLFIELMSKFYNELEKNKEKIISELNKEEIQFEKTLDNGLKIFENIEKYINKKINFLLKNPFKENLTLIEFKNDIETYLILEPFKKLFNYFDDEIKQYSSTIPLDEKQNKLALKNDEQSLNFIKTESENILKNIIINGKTVFDLYQSNGFPIEMVRDEAVKRGWKIDERGFEIEKEKHKELSRSASEGMFKGGLADHSEIVTKYHTTTHLLHQALRETLGTHVEQRGSNITSERMRFDFSHPEKLTKDQLQMVEDLVNEKISDSLQIKCELKPIEEAKKSGAIGLFGNKYGDNVNVYAIGDFSKEICGGPHVENTSELGHFKIIKEEACSAGIRRIKAILE